MIGALALAAALLAGEPRAADPSTFGRCLDEYARDLCDAKMRASIRAKTGAPDAGQLARDGYSGVRVFLVDGYSNDMPVVSVLTRDGKPAMEIRAAATGREPVVTQIAPNGWTLEVAASLQRMTLAAPERAPVAEKKAGEPPVICLHAWMAVVEVIDAGKVTTRIRGACGDAPIFDASFYLSELALQQTTACHALADNQHRSPSHKLATCATLVGKDRWSAVWLRNRFGDNVFLNPDKRTAGQAADFFAPIVMFNWEGEPVRLAQEAIDYRLTGPGARIRLYATEVEADVDGGIVRGVATRPGEGGAPTTKATFVQTWRKSKDGRTRLIRWDMTPFNVP